MRSHKGTDGGGDNIMAENKKEEMKNIKIGDKEYTPEQLQEMVGKAQSVSELEQKYNTSFDKVWPDYGRTKNEMKKKEEEWAQKEEEYKKQLESRNSNSGTYSEAEIAAARKEAKVLGIVTQEDLDAYFQEKFPKAFEKQYLTQRQVDEVMGKARKLQEEYNGEDGRPKFVQDEVIDYMKSEGIRDPEKAYKLMHEQELDKWKSEQVSKSKPRDFFTEESSQAGVDRQPDDDPVTKDNFGDRLQEVLYGGGEQA